MAWLSGWDKRIKLTVDASKIDADLTWFPVTVILSSTHGDCVFDELTADANRFKIAFTKADGTTELYGEIEKWDDTNESAIIHVSRDGWVIDDTVNTDFYMYFDIDHADNTTFIGDINSTPGANVFDSHAKAVYHQVDATTSTIKDSTSNNNDGTKKGTNEPVEAVGKVGQGQDFDGSDDYIACGTNSSLDVTTILTISACVSSDTAQLSLVAGKTDPADAGYDQWNYAFRLGADNKAILIVGNKTATTWDYALSTSALIAQDGFYHIVVTWDGTTARFYVNGTESSNHALSFTSMASSGVFRMGREQSVSQWAFDGDIDELHFSNSVARSAAWIKATYNSLWDTLLTYGDEEIGGILLEFSETLSITDTKATSGTLAKAETLSIVDSKIMSGSLGFIETLSIVDSWSALITFFETLSVVDSKFLTGTLSLAETLGIADSATYQCIKTFYETLSIIDTKITSGSLSFAETLSIVDSWSALKVFFETLSITDTVTMGGSLNVSEIISIIDSFIRWIEHPIYTEPAKSSLSFTEPTKTNPVYTKPAKGTTSFTEPAKSNPIYTEPAKGHPVYIEPTKEIRLD